LTHSFPPPVNLSEDYVAGTPIIAFKTTKPAKMGY
jgi:hypothetical protein